MTNCFAPSIISIHAAREGGDGRNFPPYFAPSVFQSTPPVKAATCKSKTTSVTLSFQSTPPVKAATRYMMNLTAMF